MIINNYLLLKLSGHGPFSLFFEDVAKELMGDEVCN